MGNLSIALTESIRDYDFAVLNTKGEVVSPVPGLMCSVFMRRGNVHVMDMTFVSCVRIAQTDNPPYFHKGDPIVHVEGNHWPIKCAHLGIVPHGFWLPRGRHSSHYCVPVADNRARTRRLTQSQASSLFRRSDR